MINLVAIRTCNSNMLTAFFFDPCKLIHMALSALLSAEGHYLNVIDAFPLLGGLR
jgi:hypothetical protein